MKFVVNDFNIYELVDGEKFFIWGTDERTEITLDPSACCFHCKREGAEARIYLEPAPGSVVVVDDGVNRREFEFVGRMLVPRSSH